MNSDQNGQRDSIEEEASLWIVRLQGDQPSEEKLQELQQWLKKSSVHQEAFKDFAGLWQDLDCLSTIVFPEVEHQQSVATKSERATDRSFMGLSIPRFGYVFASVAVLLVCVVTLMTSGLLTGVSNEENFIAEYKTATGEIQKISLPDGSEVSLNTRSKLKVSITDNNRGIHLLEGEAHFEVAHNPEKPFVVHVDDYLVRAVGTAFSIHLEGSGSLDIVVTNGRIEIIHVSELTAAEMANIGNVKVDAASTFVQGQRIFTADTVKRVEFVGDEEIEQILSWRDGMLIFDGDSLENVVKEIQRYVPAKFVIVDPELKSLKVGAYFQISDLPSMLATFETGIGIHVKEVEQGVIHLTKGSNM